MSKYCFYDTSASFIGSLFGMEHGIPPYFSGCVTWVTPATVVCLCGILTCLSFTGYRLLQLPKRWRKQGREAAYIYIVGPRGNLIFQFWKNSSSPRKNIKASVPSPPTERSK